MEKITAPRGTKDVLPLEVDRWHMLETTARRVAQSYGFQEIRFPAFEHTELFIRGVGDTTDIVQKEMYTFEDKGGRSISLRPEGTASVVRAGIEHGVFQGALPFKAHYIAPVFRYEKPQAGRLREHHQFGIECYGAAGPEADAEVIALAHTFLTNVLPVATELPFVLHLNSIGCPTCRGAYRDKLLAYLQSKPLCHNCTERMARNPLRVLDCKEASCQSVVQDAPVTNQCLCADCQTHFASVQTYVRQLGIPFVVSDRLVRGLDYYNRTVFEFICTQIGAQGTILAGGRYDGLVEQLGGPPTPACGFGCGIERILLLQDAFGVAMRQEHTPFLCITTADTPDSPAGVAARLLTQKLRAFWYVEQDITGRSLKAQFKHADRLGAKYVMTIGSTEIETATVTIKRMADGAKLTCALDSDAIVALLLADIAPQTAPVMQDSSENANL